MESPLRAAEINLRGSVARKGLKRFWDQLSRGFRSLRSLHTLPMICRPPGYPLGLKESQLYRPTGLINRITLRFAREPKHPVNLARAILVTAGIGTGCRHCVFISTVRDAKTARYSLTQYYRG